MHDARDSTEKWTCTEGDAQLAGISGCKFGYKLRVTNATYL